MTSAEITLVQSNSLFQNLLLENNSKKNKERLANSNANLMLLRIKQKRWAEALTLYEEAITLMDEVYPHQRYQRYAEVYLYRAMLEYGQGNLQEALNYCNKALEVVAPNAISDNDMGVTTGPTKRVIEVIAFRACVLQAMNRWQEALEQYELLNDFVTQTRRSYQANLSKYFLIQKVQPAYEQAIIVCRKLYSETGNPTYYERAYAFNARNKAILLLEGLQSERAMQFAGLPPSVLEQEAKLRDAVTEQETALYQTYQKGQSTDSLELVLFEQQQVYYDFIEQLEQNYPAYFELKYVTNEPPTIAGLQAALEPDRALLEYFVGEDSIFTFRITREGFRIFARAKPITFADDIELLRELLVNGIAEDCEQQFIQLAHQFYQLLLAEPLASLSESYSRLLFVPDGLLNFIAFESLLYKPLDRLRGVDGYLLERYACSYAYSSKLLLEESLPRRATQTGFAGFGMEYDDHTLRYLQELELGKFELELDSSDVQHPCGIEDTTRYLGKLNFSDDEVRNIARLLDGDTWLNEDVTKSSFLENANGYQFLHLAMHGSYDLDYPMNSSLIFTRKDSSDIFLRAAEIYGMQFDSDMVVLSACNTAHGKLTPGEGMMTLARAFHYAGIPSAVASLWSIPDRSASEIMYLFYQELDKGLPKDVALRNAKLAYLADDQLSSPSTRQPVHWAPAVVIGSVAPLPVTAGFSWWWVVVAVLILGGFLVWRRRA